MQARTPSRGPPRWYHLYLIIDFNKKSILIHSLRNCERFFFFLVHGHPRRENRKNVVLTPYLVKLQNVLFLSAQVWVLTLKFLSKFSRKKVRFFFINYECSYKGRKIWKNRFPHKDTSVLETKRSQLLFLSHIKDTDIWIFKFAFLYIKRKHQEKVLQFRTWKVNVIINYKTNFFCSSSYSIKIKMSHSLTQSLSHSLSQQKVSSNRLILSELIKTITLVTLLMFPTWKLTLGSEFFDFWFKIFTTETCQKALLSTKVLSKLTFSMQNVPKYSYMVSKTCKP